MIKQMMSKAIGIDLGTTNSAVAIMDTTDTSIIIHRDPNSKGETTPSCVWKDPKSGQFIVGRKAYSRIGNNPSPIRSIKRLMGTQKKVCVTNEDMSPEQVSAIILGEMKRQIEEDVVRLSIHSTSWIVDRAIVTVPAYFDQPQIEATRKAAEMAGLQVLELLHEPTAAACYYCWETQTQNGTFLVYDLGGGTFDVSILRCTEGEFEVLGISGNNRLGGDDIDTLLAEDIQKRLISDDYNLNLDWNDPEDKLRFDKLKLLAEGVKKALSTNSEFILRDTATLQDKSGERVDIELTFERQEFEKLIQPFVERTLPYCYEALQKAELKAGITLADIDQVILVGGSTHIPFVREMVQQRFCASTGVTEPRARCSEPVYRKVDTIVALGAAIRAAATGGIMIYNPERTVRISFRGMGVTAAKQTYIGGQVEALDPEITLSGATIRLTIPDINFEDEQDLKENRAFSFTRIPLQAGASNLLLFGVFDSQGRLIAELDRSINQSREMLRPTGGSTGTAIRSKTLFLDINDSGVVKRIELIGQLQTIPMSITRSFAHPGNTDHVRLPLYENHRQIRTIVVPTSPVPPEGTEVRLTVTIDKLDSISVEGDIGNVSFSFTFKGSAELASERNLPTDSEVQALHQKFLHAIEYLPRGKKTVAEARYRQAKLNYDASMKREDTAQAIHEFEEMEYVVAGIAQNITSLYPPKEIFDQLVGECQVCNRDTMQLSSNLDQPHDYREMAKTIEAQRMQGEQACENGDQAMYSDVIEMLEAIRDHLIMIIRKEMNIVDTRTETEKASDYLRYASQETTTVDQLVSKLGNQQQQAQIRQIKQELASLADEVQRNPQQTQFKIAQSQARLEQIKNQLVESKGVPDIEGLVKQYLK